MSSDIQITLNGEPFSVNSDARLTALIDGLNLKRGRVAVEINYEIVPKAQWNNVTLASGDIVEIVNFVGGG
ncbi:MAG: sulfur carrier protein ThiS [Candidatus Binataceae bacterium]|jgi:sulfur carrier protein